MARTRLHSRLLLMAAAFLAAALFCEVVFRCYEPPTRPATGVILAANGQRVPLGEIGHFLTRRLEFEASLNAELQEPHGMLQANLHLLQGYENPKPRWSYFDGNGCVAYDTNRLGLRDLDFPVAKQPGEFRVLALGDSFTYGQGLRLDLTWPQVLEARLRRARKHPVEVINAGFAAGPGVHSPDGYDRWLESQGIRFAPDLVITGICLNDLGDVPLLSYPTVTSEPVLGGWSHLLNYLVWTRRQAEARKQKLDVCAPVRKDPSRWVGTQRGLLAMQALLQQRQVPFLVAVFPMLSHLDDYPYGELHDLVTAFCQQHGIRCLDLRHAFDGMDEMDLWVHLSDQHPNHEGNRIMAEKIHAHLAEQGLLPQ